SIMDHPPNRTIRENGPNRRRKLSRRPGRRITAATSNQSFHRPLKKRRAGRSRRVTRRCRTTGSNVSPKAPPITATPTTPPPAPLWPELGHKPVRVPRAHGHLSIVPSIDDIDSPSIRSAVQGDCWHPHRSDLLIVLHRVLLHTGVTSHAAAAPVASQKW